MFLCDMVLRCTGHLKIGLISWVGTSYNRSDNHCCIYMLLRNYVKPQYRFMFIRLPCCLEVKFIRWERCIFAVCFLFFVIFIIKTDIVKLVYFEQVWKIMDVKLQTRNTMRTLTDAIFKMIYLVFIPNLKLAARTSILTIQEWSVWILDTIFKLNVSCLREHNISLTVLEVCY